METWIPIIISLFSLFVSIGTIIFSILKDRRDNANLHVNWDSQTVWTYGLFDRNKGKTILNMVYGQAEFEIRVVNPSDKDIGYFDFRVLNGSEPLPYYSPAHLNAINKTENLKIDTVLMKEGESFPIVLPSGNGVFPAHTETVLAVVTTPTKDLNTITFVFKIARLKSKFHKKTAGYIYSNFESYLGDVKVDWSNKPNYKAMKDQLNKIRNKENNSNSN